MRVVDRIAPRAVSAYLERSRRQNVAHVIEFDENIESSAMCDEPLKVRSTWLCCTTNFAAPEMYVEIHSQDVCQACPEFRDGNSPCIPTHCQTKLCRILHCVGINLTLISVVFGLLAGCGDPLSNKPRAQFPGRLLWLEHAYEQEQSRTENWWQHDAAEGN